MKNSLAQTNTIWLCFSVESARNTQNFVSKMFCGCNLAMASVMEINNLVTGVLLSSVIYCTILNQWGRVEITEPSFIYISIDLTPCIMCIQLT